MYGYPLICRLEHPQTRAITIYRRFHPGAVVEHRSLPGVSMVVTEGPEQGLFGMRYTVQMPGGRLEKVLENNLLEV